MRPQPVAPSAAAALLCLLGCGDTTPIPSSAPSQPASAVASVASTLQPWAPISYPDPGDDLSSRRFASRGPAPLAVADSPRELQRATPEMLLRDALDSLELADLPALARLSLAGPQPLTEDDLADARRRFLAPGPRTTWARIAAAVGRGDYVLEREASDRATLRVAVGGAAGSFTLVLQKGDAGWFLAG